ncbi:MAG: putative Se/S carrier-like protein, partial [Fusobacteriaceae bacterium]
SASCGLSIKTELESLEKIRNILEMENLNLDFYKVKKMGIKKIIEKIDQ